MVNPTLPHSKPLHDAELLEELAFLRVRLHKARHLIAENQSGHSGRVQRELLQTAFVAAQLANEALGE